MHPIPTRILLLLLFFSSLVAAANFTQCLEDFRNNDPTTIGGVDSRGHATSPAAAVGLTYETCRVRCGSEAESFRWKEFAQLFSSWLLPWLALISQLPYGSGNYADDFVSVAMSVGSPALAAYSLALTSLNARLVFRRAQRIKDKSRTDVARALVALQQTPLELTKDERLLAFIPTNDQWRQEIADRLSRRNAWSLATGSSVAWVVVAFLFTLVDSFVSLDDTIDGDSEGHAVGTLWLWLLCLVIGWLWVPTFTCGELKTAISHANQKAAKKAAKRIRQEAAKKIKQEATKAYNSAKSKITRLPKRVPLLKGPKKPVGDLPEVPEENEKVKEKEEDSKSVGEETEPNTSPLPNLARRQSTVSSQSTESQQGGGHDQPGDNANPAAGQSVVSLPRSTAARSTAAESSIHPDKDRLLIPKGTFGSLNRDELRLAATFNYSRIMGYLVLVDDVLRALDKLTREKEEKKRNSELAGSEQKKRNSEATDFQQEKRKSEIPAIQPAGKVVFPPGALIAMFNASIFALILQCGTSAAAAVIIVFTPTVGLGCRSLGYIIYGGTAVVILFLTMISTIFARISETRNKRSAIVKTLTAFIAIALRRISLLLAFINATGLVVLSCFQFSHFLDNCYCNASVLGRGFDSYVIITYEGWISTMRTARIAATVLAAVSMAIYMIFLWLMSALPSEIDYL